MLTEQQEKEISKLSPDLRDKIMAMFTSPYYLLFQAIDTQIKAFAQDVINKPYTIRGSSENEQSKAEFDSMLKAMDKMESLSDMREKFRLNLNPEELKKIDTILTTADVRKEALNGKKQ
jgi:hypothetical protein